MLKFKDKDSGEIEVDVQYCNNEKTYEIKNNTEHISYKINCPKDINDSWDSGNYELFLFKNSHYDAESNLFRISVKDKNGERRSIGYIFPISRLESMEPEEAESSNFRAIDFIRKYKFVCYEKLLKSNYIVNRPKNEETFISKLFPDISVLIISKELCPLFKIYDYLPCLYEKGFLYISEDLNIKVASLHSDNRFNLPKDDIDLSLNIKAANYNSPYIKQLLSRDLISVENYLARFIMLYQVIEMHISKIYDDKFNNNLKEYQEGKISQNDLRDIIKYSERERIKDFLSNSKIKNEPICTKIEQKIDNLAKKLDVKIGKKPSFEDKLYFFRNKIVHDFHRISHLDKQIQDIVDDFELIIVKILIENQIIYKDKAHLKIEKIAYANHLKCPDNTDLENWLLAEKEYFSN